MEKLGSLETRLSQNPLTLLAFFRGVCMYRTVKTQDLILKGVPDSLRAEVWLIFSGAINQVQVATNVGVDAFFR